MDTPDFKNAFVASRVQRKFHSPEKNISAIVSCLADDRVARGGEHVQLGHLGEHLEDLGLLQGVVGDVQDRELLAALQLPDVVACLQFIPSRL